jgi:hypothetical protein
MTLRRSRIAPESRKGAARRRDYDKVRKAVYERSGGRCEVNATWSCSGQCEQVHHKQGRIGDRLTDIDKMVGICHNCHEFIGRNPALAYDRGWMLRRNTDD